MSSTRRRRRERAETVAAEPAPTRAYTAPADEFDALSQRASQVARHITSRDQTRPIT